MFLEEPDNFRFDTMLVDVIYQASSAGCVLWAGLQNFLSDLLGNCNEVRKIRIICRETLIATEKYVYMS